MEIPSYVFVGIGGLVLIVSLLIDVRKMAIFELAAIILIIYGIVKIIMSMTLKKQKKEQEEILRGLHQRQQAQMQAALQYPARRAVYPQQPQHGVQHPMQRPPQRRI